MAVTATLYPKVMEHFAQGRIAYSAVQVKVALVKGTYTPSESHQWWSDVSAHQSADSPASGDPAIGYTSLGKTLTSKTTTYNAGTRTTSLDAADVAWLNLNLPDVKYAVVFVNTGTNSSSPLIGYVNLDWTNPDSGTVGTYPRGMFAKDLTLTWDAAGIAVLPVAA